MCIYIYIYLYLFIYILKKCKQRKETGKSSGILSPFNICLDVRGLVSVDKESLLAKGVNQNHAAVAVVTIRGQTRLLILNTQKTTLALAFRLTKKLITQKQLLQS